MLAGRRSHCSASILPNTRLPMVARDHLPFIGSHGFASLQDSGELDSIVAVVTLASPGSLIGLAGSVSLIDNAAGIYAIAYLVLFAIPICGLKRLNLRPPVWLKTAATPALTTLLHRADIFRLLR
jgi:hypothetical protein